MRKNWTPEEDNILKNNYKKYELKELVSLLPGRNYNAVKARQTFLRICTVYRKDDNFFQIPNILNSGIAGFVSSDGHISQPKIDSSHPRECALNWGINTKDRRLLEQINFYLKSNYKISDSIKEREFRSKIKKSYKYIDYKSRLCISSAHKLAQDLKRHWNIPAGAKSLIIGAPNITDLDCCLAYIKGLIIGDGTILATNLSDNIYVRVSLVGTEKLLIWVKETLERYLEEKMDTIHVHRPHKEDNVFLLSITGLKASRIIYKLNQLNTLSLDRKFKKPEVLEIIKRQKSENPHLFPDEI